MGLSRISFIVIGALLLTDVTLISIHYGYHTKKIKTVIENKVGADLEDILAHLYQRGNFQHLRTHLESYISLGVTCLNVIDVDNREIFRINQDDCEFNRVAKNYIDQPVLYFSYSLPNISLRDVFYDMRHTLSVLVFLKFLFIYLVFLYWQTRKNSMRKAIIADASQSLAHDLKVPLMTFRHMVDRKFNSQDAEDQSVRRILDRIEAILDGFQNIDSEVMVSKKWLIFDLSKISQEAQDYLVKYSFSIQVYNQLGDGLVLIDSTKIQRVLINLIKNAVEAMANQITVECFQCDDSKDFLIVVSDNGQGVPEKDIKNIFEKGFTTKEKGLGLGLAYARRVVQAHGGELTYERRENTSKFRLIFYSAFSLKEIECLSEVVHPYVTGKDAFSESTNGPLFFLMLGKYSLLEEFKKLLPESLKPYVIFDIKHLAKCTLVLSDNADLQSQCLSVSIPFVLINANLNPNDLVQLIRKRMYLFAAQGATQRTVPDDGGS